VVVECNDIYLSRRVDLHRGIHVAGVEGRHDLNTTLDVS